MPRSSWIRMWQCSTYRPVKSTKGLRILNQPGMNSVQLPEAHRVYGRTGAGQSARLVVVRLTCCPVGIGNVSHQIHHGGPGATFGWIAGHGLNGAGVVGATEQGLPGGVASGAVGAD